MDVEFYGDIEVSKQAFRDLEREMWTNAIVFYTVMKGYITWLYITLISFLQDTGSLVSRELKKLRQGNGVNGGGRDQYC